MGPNNYEFIETLALEIHATARSKGWYDGTEVNIPEKLALIHSEVSEALEEYRDGHPVDGIYYKGEKPEGFPVELADALIRILDLAAYLQIDLGRAVECKMAYNATRPHRHGGKLA